MSRIAIRPAEGLVSATFREQSQEPKIQQIPLSHLSVEVGHFYMEELENGEDPIREQFERVRPWLEAAEKTAVSGRAAARVSTCFLIDDYFNPQDDAHEIMERLLRLSTQAGVRIDYVARESSCALSKDGVSPAELVTARLLAEPAPETTGTRPPVHESGWLANGQPSREQGPVLGAMRPREKWRPAEEFGRRNHSVFLDVELWKARTGRPAGQQRDTPDNRQWSCAFLASVWQLVRLGLLRDHGRPVLEVKNWDPQDPWPREWVDFPDVVKVNPAAKPFYAYRTCSLMPQDFLATEHAVQTVLSHVLPDDTVVRSVAERAAEEGITLPESIANRVINLFLEGGR